MIDISLKPLHDKATSSFPLTSGQFGITPILIQGRIRLRSLLNSQDVMTVSIPIRSIVVRVRCYQRCSPNGSSTSTSSTSSSSNNQDSHPPSTSHSNSSSSTSTTTSISTSSARPHTNHPPPRSILWEKEIIIKEADPEQGDNKRWDRWSRPFQIAIPPEIRRRAPGTTKMKDYGISWRLEAVAYHTPLFGVGDRITKSYSLPIFDPSSPSESADWIIHSSPIQTIQPIISPSSTCTISSTTSLIHPGTKFKTSIELNSLPKELKSAKVQFALIRRTRFKTQEEERRGSVMSIGSVRSEISPSSLGSIQSDASSSAYALSAASASSSSSPSGSLYLMKSNESDKDGDKRIAKGKGKEKDHNNSTSHRFGSGWGLGSYFPPSSTASTSTLTPSTVPSPLRSEVISETVVCKGHWIELKSVAGENRKGGYKGEQELALLEQQQGGWDIGWTMRESGVDVTFHIAARVCLVEGLFSRNSQYKLEGPSIEVRQAMPASLPISSPHQPEINVRALGASLPDNNHTHPQLSISTSTSTSTPLPLSPSTPTPSSPALDIPKKTTGKRKARALETFIPIYGLGKNQDITLPPPPKATKIRWKDRESSASSSPVSVVGLGLVDSMQVVQQGASGSGSRSGLGMGKEVGEESRKRSGETILKVPQHSPLVLAT